MKIIDIIIAIICSLIVVFSLLFAIINKRKGKTSCGCNCSKCSECKNRVNKENK